MTKQAAFVSIAALGVVVAAFVFAGVILRTTVVLVTHDPGFASRAARQIHLVDGRVVPA